MSVDEDGLRAHFSRGAQGHGRADAELPRFVGCRRDHAALAALASDDYGLAFQTSVEKFFHGNEEGVHIDVEDGAGESGLVSGRHAMRILAAVGLAWTRSQHIEFKVMPQKIACAFRDSNFC